MPRCERPDARGGAGAGAHVVSWLSGMRVPPTPVRLPRRSDGIGGSGMDGGSAGGSCHRWTVPQLRPASEVLSRLSVVDSGAGGRSDARPPGLHYVSTPVQSRQSAIQTAPAGHRTTGGGTQPGRRPRAPVDPRDGANIPVTVSREPGDSGAHCQRARPLPPVARGRCLCSEALPLCCRPAVSRVCSRRHQNLAPGTTPGCPSSRVSRSGPRLVRPQVIRGARRLDRCLDRVGSGRGWPSTRRRSRTTRPGAAPGPRCHDTRGCSGNQPPPTSAAHSARSLRGSRQQLRSRFPGGGPVPDHSGVRLLHGPPEPGPVPDHRAEGPSAHPASAARLTNPAEPEQGRSHPAPMQAGVRESLPTRRGGPGEAVRPPHGLKPTNPPPAPAAPTTRASNTRVVWTRGVRVARLGTGRATGSGTPRSPPGAGRRPAVATARPRPRRRARAEHLGTHPDRASTDRRGPPDRGLGLADHRRPCHDRRGDRGVRPMGGRP